MKTLKTLWTRLPRLPRRWRIVRNLGAAMLLLALALHLGGLPNWMGYWAFRQLEASYLLTPSRVICTNRAASGEYTAWLTEGERWITVGRTTRVDGGGLYHEAFPALNHVLPKEGIVAAALPAPNADGGMTVAVWGAPEGAVSGAIEVDLNHVDAGVFETLPEETFSARGERLENGWFLFELAPHPEGHGDRVYCAMSCLWDWEARVMYGFAGERPCRLRLWDETGKEVLSWSGTLPPNQCLTQR